MAASDQYQVDIASVKALIQAWQKGSGELAAISTQLSQIHGQLMSSIPSALFEGLLGEVPLAESFAKVAAAASTAKQVAQGLENDTLSLDANLAAYVETEASIEAKLRSIKNHQGGVTSPHGTTHPSGGGHGGSGSSRHGPHHGSHHGSSPGSGGGSGSGRGTQPPGPAQYANQAQVESWIDQAFQALEASGVPAGELDKAGVLLIIEHESSGNPNAINNWDSNAKAGDPSRGLMQVIGTTFDEYKLPGHSDIYNPVDNIIAGVRYALSRYGSIQNVPGVKSVDSGGSYVGY
ncbi:transglycosylase SLT domain-containing protein [Actinospica sp. MGRD01-02]|uniref:Transglycosylase SLT domain-containing protein n=1 Tax=Actinospica acidithermotolerans TaxID=2828514 RepID=A0A941EPK3_9ACTN|nr:transglycosylase SLT domain-containing protein [Actinospica acidithermotolerans]MBR7831424.1 transglycosylase SLT domain-containing protein [Actinospica acidithermotolerans]